MVDIIWSSRMAAANVVEKFRNESVNGIPISVLKSAVQKYARRGLLEDGLRVLGLLSFFSEPRIITNVTNRLVVMMSEETSIQETFLPVTMKSLHEEFCRTRSHDVWLRMYALLCQGRKCRVVSDVKTRWNLPPYKGSVARLDELHRKLLAENGISPVENPPGTIEAFQARLSARSYEVFDVLRVLLRSDRPGPLEGLSEPRTRARCALEKSIWEAIERECSAVNEALSPVVSALCYFYKKMHHAERPIYIYHAVLLVLNADALDYEAPSPDIASPNLNLETWRKEGAGVTLESFPDFVIDRHTTLARNQSPVVFAEVGAWIPNEDKRFLNEEHRRLYHAFKVLQENGGK
jgi:hypothetical protein